MCAVISTAPSAAKSPCRFPGHTAVGGVPALPDLIYRHIGGNKAVVQRIDQFLAEPAFRLEILSVNSPVRPCHDVIPELLYKHIEIHYRKFIENQVTPCVVGAHAECRVIVGFIKSMAGIFDFSGCGFCATLDISGCGSGCGSGSGSGTG